MDTDDLLGTDTDPLENTVNLESTFNAQGYTSGHDHGRLHGLFEGRALGSEKAFEIWEEVAYYEGWAEFWIGMLEREGKEGRVFWHAKHLLELISSFPTTNPSPSDNPAGPPQPGIDSATSSTSPDLPTLLSQIRARYRLLCSSLGVRPRLVASKDGTAAAGASEQNGTEGGVVERIEGRMKGVDTKKLLF